MTGQLSEGNSLCAVPSLARAAASRRIKSSCSLTERVEGKSQPGEQQRLEPTGLSRHLLAGHPIGTPQIHCRGTGHRHGDRRGGLLDRRGVLPTANTSRARCLPSPLAGTWRTLQCSVTHTCLCLEQTLGSHTGQTAQLAIMGEHLRREQDTQTTAHPAGTCGPTTQPPPTPYSTVGMLCR